MSYARMDRDFWESEARERLGRDYQAVECWMWLWGSACASSLGVYRVPMRTLAAQLWCESLDEARAVVLRVVAALGPLGAIRYEPSTGDVWVVNCAKKQHDAIKAKDNRRYTQALVSDIEKAQRSPFWAGFVERYRTHLLLDDPDPRAWPESGRVEGPNAPLPKGLARGENTPPEGVPEPLPKGCAHPALPSPALPNPSQSSGGSNAHVREHTHAREAGLAAAAAALTPDHDPWPEQASRAAAHLYIAIRRAEGVEPVGDVCEPFERAVCVLTTKLGIPREQAGPTLERIVRHASTDPAVRRARAGDLFRSPFYLLGNPSPKGGAGVPMVDKLRRYLEDLAQVDAATTVHRTGRLEAAAKDRADYFALDIGQVWDDQNPELLAELEAAGMIPQAIAGKPGNLPAEARNDPETGQRRGSALNGRTGADFGPSCASGLEAV